MGNLVLPIPNWRDDDTENSAFLPTSGGILDGLPSYAPGNGLHLLMDPNDAAAAHGLPPVTDDGQGQARTAPLTIDEADTNHLVPGFPDGSYLPSPGPKNPIGRVQGYPETGKNAWRAGNDDAIVAAANKYNGENGYFPGDAEYMSPQLMKAWQMRESGGSRQALQTDPFQVNNPRDWASEKYKIAGLTEGQVMTPHASADAALKWLHYKGQIGGNRDHQSLVPYQGLYMALRNYNAAPGTINGIPKKDDYANTVLNNAWASYGDWQK